MPVGVFSLLLRGKLGLANKILWLYLLGLGAAGSAVLMVYYSRQSGKNKIPTIKQDMVITKTDTIIHKHKTSPRVPPKDTMARKRKTISPLTANDTIVRKQKKSSPLFLKDSTVSKYKSSPSATLKDTIVRRHKKLPPYAPKDSMFLKHKSLPPPIRDTTVRKRKKGFAQ